jgi:WD40 repeat protein
VVVFSPIAAASQPPVSIAPWDAGTSNPSDLGQRLARHAGLITGLAFSGDGRRLFSSGGEDKTIKVWDPQTGEEVLNLRGHSCFATAWP